MFLVNISVCVNFSLMLYVKIIFQNKLIMGKYKSSNIQATSCILEDFYILWKKVINETKIYAEVFYDIFNYLLS